MKTTTSFAPTQLHFAKLLVVSLVLLTASVVMAAPPTEPEPMSEKTALQYFRDEGITVGINVGNTLDAYKGQDPSTWVADETVWGNPKVNQAYITGLKNLGFNIIRIPVTWMGHIGSAPDYKISESYLQRVAEVVDYAKNAGLKAFINIHHDGHSNTGDPDGWLSINQAVAGDNSVTDKYYKVWKQIAEHFVNYGDWLMFQGFNEIHRGDWNPAGTIQEYAVINEWNQKFTEAVRSTGGNNAKRYLLYYGYFVSYSIAGTDYSKFTLPNDGDNGSTRQVVCFHWYEPGIFSHDGKTHTWEDISYYKSHQNTAFAAFKTNFYDKGIPVIMGENGPIRYRYNNANTSTAQNNRLLFIDYMYGSARENGIIPLYWEQGGTPAYHTESDAYGDFGLMNRNTGLPNSLESWTVIERMINATQGTTATVGGQWEWGSFTDVDNGGNSTINFSEASGTVTISGTVNNGYQYGYVGWQATPKDNATKAALASAISISFKVTGDGKTYRIMLPTSDITDYCYHSATFPTTNGVETTVTLNISDFAQADWCTVKKPLNKSLIKNIEWQSPDGVFGTFSIVMSDLSLERSIEIKLPQVVITTNPTSTATVAPNATHNLTVAATGNGTLTYQWYSNTTASNSGGTLITGATNSTYAPSTATEGTSYYYVVVTNTIPDNINGGNKSVSTTSNVATVKVDSNSPIIFSQIANSNIRIYATGNNIMLQNLPQNANVQVYNLTGKQIHSSNSENSQILRIPVQTKGMYFVKANKQTQRVVVK